MQISPQEAYRLVEDELIKMGLQLKAIMTRDDIFNLIDRKMAGRTFDSGVAIQLVDQIDKDNYGQFPLGSFVDVILEARSILMQKIADTSASLDNFQQQKMETLEQLKIHTKEERLNSYGIMNDSVLIVQELQVAELDIPQNSQLYFRVSCENNNFQSEIQVYREVAEWPDQFKAEIKTGQDDVQFILCIVGRDNESEILGGVGIPIEKLRDQQRHEEWFDLFDPNGNPLVRGKIHVSLHWIHSRVKYLSDLINGWDEHIRLLNEDKNDYQKDLDQIYALFPSLLPKRPVQSERVKRAALPPTETPATTVATTEPSSFISKIMLFLSLGLTGIGIFGCFLKAMFLDVLLGSGFLLAMVPGKRYTGTTSKAKQLLGLSVLAVLIDIFWLVIFTQGWDDTFVDFEISTGAMRFVIILRIISLIVKVALIICHFGFFQVPVKPETGARQTQDFGSSEF